jgi:deoxyribose-phosphate aldolase
MKPLNKYIDHTLLKPAATPQDIITLCEEAVQYDFFSVCVNSCYVRLAKEHIKKSDVAVCSVIGFPLGAMHTNSKVFEAKQAINNGASEIDMVLNIGHLKSGYYQLVLEDIKKVKDTIGEHVLKVILEISELTNEEIVKACELCLEANADFVKTSTGFSSGGATIEATKLMLETVNGKAKIKASGGIRDFETAKQYLDLGVDRLGVSAGIAIINGTTENTDY